MVDNNFQEILFIEISDLRKYINDLEDLFIKYSSLSENINPESAVEQFPNDWQEYIMPQKRPQIRKKIAKEYDLISNSFKDSLFKIKRVLMDDDKFHSHSNKKDVEQIVKSIEQLENNPIFCEGLKEKNDMDYIKNIKFFEGGAGISLAKIQIGTIISSIGSLSLESKKNPVIIINKFSPKIKDLFLKYIIRGIVGFFLLYLMYKFGIKQ